MQTIKTGVVIALLIAVCYGAFIALNAPEADIPESIQEWANKSELDDLTVDVNMGFDLGSTQSVSPDSLVGSYNFPDDRGAPSVGNNAPSSSTLAFPDVNLPSNPTSGDFAASSTPTMPEFPNSVELPPGTRQPNSLAGSLDVDINLPQLGADGPAVPFDADASSPTKGELVSTNAGFPNANDGFESGTNVNSSNQPGELPNTLPLLDNAETSTGSTANAAVQPAMPELPYAIAREQALMKADAGDLTAALKMLSPFYNSPDMDFKEHEDLLDILDALCRHAIYSSSYLLEPAYTVSANETIATIAEKHQITPELLSDINGIKAGHTLAPGSTLKVIKGPFRAQIQIRRRQLAVFLGDLYAGRFDIELGSDPIPTPGIYEVDDRRRDRTYYQAGGAVIQANEPKNPYGGFWISLGGNLSIHGSPSIDVPELQNAGCISLAPIDAQHVYNMLIKHSQVQVVP